MYGTRIRLLHQHSFSSTVPFKVTQKGPSQMSLNPLAQEGPSQDAPKPLVQEDLSQEVLRSKVLKDQSQEVTNLLVTNAAILNHLKAFS